MAKRKLAEEKMLAVLHEDCPELLRQERSGDTRDIPYQDRDLIGVGRLVAVEYVDHRRECACGCGKRLPYGSMRTALYASSACSNRALRARIAARRAAESDEKKRARAEARKRRDAERREEEAQRLTRERAMQEDQARLLEEGTIGWIVRDTYHRGLARNPDDSISFIAHGESLEPALVSSRLAAETLVSLALATLPKDDLWPPLSIYRAIRASTARRVAIDGPTVTFPG